jgi:hypothetical protein
MFPSQYTDRAGRQRQEEAMNRLVTLASVAFVWILVATPAMAQWKPPTTEVPKEDAAYIAKVKTAAPPSVVNNATIVRPPPQGLSQVLQNGTNGYTCFVGDDGTPECDDANAMEWRKALWAKHTPPNSIGFIFMLAGDTGINNHDASVTDKTEHWVETGPHVMIVGGATRDMLSQYPRDHTVKDASAPFIMFPGKPNEHLMIPVHMEPIRSN